METLVANRRVLLGFAVGLLLALLIPVRGSEFPAAMGLMLIEVCGIGLGPLLLGFLGQLAAGGRVLRDRVLLAYAAAMSLVIEVTLNSSPTSLGRQILSVVFFTLLLTLFASLGASLARAIRRRLSVTA